MRQVPLLTRGSSMQPGSFADTWISEGVLLTRGSLVLVARLAAILRWRLHQSAILSRVCMKFIISSVMFIIVGLMYIGLTLACSDAGTDGTEICPAGCEDICSWDGFAWCVLTFGWRARVTRLSYQRQWILS